jgi:5'-phosphate synthase pdxT subunit
MQPSPSTSSSASNNPAESTSLTIGVLALQGAFVEHISLLSRAATHTPSLQKHSLNFIEVRTPSELSSCAALILPGGESTAISLIAARCGLLEPLREFVKLHRKPVWGTCAGLILLAESANKSRAAGQELIGGLDVRVQRNYFGRQVESFEADLKLKFLEGQEPFHSVFIRAPVVEKVLDAQEVEALRDSSAKDGDDEEGVVKAPAVRGTEAEVEILCRLPGRAKALRDQTTTAEMLGEDGDIVAVRQGNVFGTSFHPELTGDERIHAWWLEEVIKAAGLAGQSS